ncbi:protein gustavus-like [Dreissena polymorpha]|nr:protein gustavus-like [Dreissena polymorpha]
MVTNSIQILGGVMLILAMVFLVMLCADDQVYPEDPLPTWVTLIHHDRAIDTGILGNSEGISVLDHNSLVRHRKGHFETDGAKWGAGLMRGKHVFEIYWPTDFRDACATVGIGTEEAPLHSKPRCSLIGASKHSWGLNIVKCRVFHNGEIQFVYPREKRIPSRFFMYVDCDSQTLGFGTEVAFWGSKIRFPRTALPVYPMVGVVCEGAQISLIYRGSAYFQAPAVQGEMVGGLQLKTFPGGYNPQPLVGGYNPPPLVGGFNPPPLVGGYNPPPLGGGYYQPQLVGGYNPPSYSSKLY